MKKREPKRPARKAPAKEHPALVLDGIKARCDFVPGATSGTLRMKMEALTVKTRGRDGLRIGGIDIAVPPSGVVINDKRDGSVWYVELADIWAAYEAAREKGAKP